MLPDKKVLAIIEMHNRKVDERNERKAYEYWHEKR